MENYERFKNQQLEIIAYSDVKTFIRFCATHQKEVKEFREHVRKQVLRERECEIDESDIDEII